jgi:hypothetical protein
LHSAQIKKSDDLDNACAKSQGLKALLAQAVAMQIISTPEFSNVAFGSTGIASVERRPCADSRTTRMLWGHVCCNAR